MTRRLLVVTRETTFTGAPINLLHSLRWLTERGGVDVELVALRNGPLVPAFEAVCPVVAPGIDAPDPASAPEGPDRSALEIARQRSEQRLLREQLDRAAAFDLLYVNGADGMELLPPTPLPLPLVAHIHEMAMGFASLAPEAAGSVARRPDRVIAASDAVRTVLIDDLGVAPEKIRVHHEFIDARTVADRAVDRRGGSQLRIEAGIPADAAIVMGCGLVEWRKGVDLFVQLAAEVQRLTRDPVHFVWVGRKLNDGEAERVLSDLRWSGAAPIFHWVPEQPDPGPWFDLADVFALTSREDPFPLVCLEHAARSHPVIGYRTGGLGELLDAAGDEAARGGVAHLDVTTLARRLVELLDSAPLRRTVGRQLQSVVLRRHDVGVAGPKLLADLEEIMERST